MTIISACFVFNWDGVNRLQGEARSISNMSLPRVQLLIAGYFRRFLTRLVQNLTLRNDCNLTPSAHGTQRVVLSKQSLDSSLQFTWIYMLLVRGEMVDDAQLSP